MTANAQKVLDDALTLPANDRAELAAELLASLDAVEAGVEAAWAAEIERRAADARENPGDEEDWRSALAEVQREVLSASPSNEGVNADMSDPAYTEI